jgi:catalase
MLTTILKILLLCSAVRANYQSQSNPAADQILQYRQRTGAIKILQTAPGAPIGDKSAALTVGERGPILMNDFVFRDEVADSVRERIPERLVHAKGAGAYGYFEVTNDISNLTRADLFSHVGKRTPIMARFSTVIGESGSADTVREPRGYAVKFYTKEGNWDLLCLNQPVFFISDPLLFTGLLHSVKRNPATHFKDANMFWDFATLRPETLHMHTFLFSDVGIPRAYSFMNGFAINTFRFENVEKKTTFVRFHLLTEQGIKNLTVEEAARLAGEDPDYANRELYNRIGRGNFPSWKMFIQVMTTENAERFPFNPFDATLVWPVKEFPLHPVGRLVFTRNPANVFAEVEQAAFCPTHFVPGIAASPDKLLQGRMFTYPDAQRYRVGVNHLLLPVNRPYVTSNNYQRDGPMMFTDNHGGAPNYFPNSFNGPEPNPKFLNAPYGVSGQVMRFNDSSPLHSITQAGIRFREELDAGAQQRLINNLAGSIEPAAPFLQKRAVRLFRKIDRRLGNGIANALNRFNGRMKKSGRSNDIWHGDWRDNIFHKLLPNQY